MSEPKDPAIKLFGKTIPLPEASPPSPPPPSSLPGNHTTASVNHDLDSPSSSFSPEGNIHGDVEDLEADKVWICLKSFSILFFQIPFSGLILILLILLTRHVFLFGEI